MNNYKQYSTSYMNLKQQMKMELEIRRYHLPNKCSIPYVTNLDSIRQSIIEYTKLSKEEETSNNRLKRKYLSNSPEEKMYNKKVCTTHECFIHNNKNICDIYGCNGIKTNKQLNKIKEKSDYFI